MIFSECSSRSIGRSKSTRRFSSPFLEPINTPSASYGAIRPASLAGGGFRSILVALKIILLLLGGFWPRVENIYSPTPDSRRASIILNIPRTRGK